MDATTHKLSALEAEQIKEALLRTLASVTSPVDVAQELIKAFALIDATTESAS